MRVLITSAKIIDPNSEHHGKILDILIDKGIIQVGKNLKADGAENIHGEGLCVSPGWFDMRVNFQDPGHEYREDLLSGCEASAYGGFTGVALMPETEPLISGKSQIEYIKNRTADNIVDVFPVATMLSASGDTISEMHDLKQAGAIAFSSGYKSISDEGLLLRAMQYSITLDMPLILTPVNKSLYGKGVMNEGLINVQLGMKGIPVMADEIEVYKFVTLCRYTGAKIHIAGISSMASLRIANAAKKEGLKISTEVFGHHLSFDENDLLNFNTNLKFRPPLRTKEDKTSLQNSLLNGDIDCASSDHHPLEEDLKKCEFEIAGYGASGTQTLFSQLLDVFSENKLAEIINAIAIKPREILGLTIPTIKDGEIANLTIFDPKKDWKLDEKTNKSKSNNNPYWKKDLKGKAIAIINNNKIKYLS